MRTIIKGTSLDEVTKRTKAAQKRGWEPLMPKPKFIAGYSHLGVNDYFVMVMEHKTLKKTTDRKRWNY